MGGMKWTKAQDRHLAFLWCELDLVKIAKRLGRTPYAVEHRARDLKLPRHREEGETLSEFSARTGYSRRMIWRATKALGIYLPFRPRLSTQTSLPITAIPARSRGAAGARVIDPVVADQLIAKMTEIHRAGSVRVHGVWGANGKPPCCTGCGRSDRRHVGLGLCSSCYEHQKYLKRKARRAQERRRLHARALSH